MEKSIIVGKAYRLKGTILNDTFVNKDGMEKINCRTAMQGKIFFFCHEKDCVHRFPCLLLLHLYTYYV